MRTTRCMCILNRGRGVRTILATATRGDGGQNEIGPELHDPLAVLRTEELEAMHRFDSSEQYFTRAVDFGYSFSIEETLEKWGRDEIVGDGLLPWQARKFDFTAGGPGGGGQGQPVASAPLPLGALHLASIDVSGFDASSAHLQRSRHRRAGHAQESAFEHNQGWKKGALVSAPVGKGHWIYVGLGVWRQVTAGTDGA